MILIPQLLFQLSALLLQLHHSLLHLLAVLLIALVLLVECRSLLPCDPQLIHERLYPLRELILPNDSLQRLPLVALYPLQTPHLLLQSRDHQLGLLQLILKLDHSLKTLLVVQTGAQSVVLFLEGLY